MTTIEATHKKPIQFLSASWQFWLCNIVGWFVFDVAQGLRASFSGGSVLNNFIKYIPTAMLGIFVSLCIHFFYKKFQWHKHHPTGLIPIAGLISITFACINTFVNLSDLVVSISEICSREYLRPPNSCGVVSDLFLQSLGIMLVWCLFYFLIQAERHNQQGVRLSGSDISKAIFTLLILNHLGTLLSVLAYVEWGNTHYLFSNDYFFGAVSGIIFTILFASYILFIQPGGQLFGSRILPLIPTLCAMSFCCAVLSIGAGSAFSRLYYLQPNGYSSLTDYAHYILFGKNYGNFTSKGHLAGVLQGVFMDNLIVALFFLNYRYSGYWQIPSKHQPIEIGLKKSFAFWGCNFLFWLFFGLLIYATDLMDITSIGTSTPLISTISFAGVGIFMGAVLRAQIKYFATVKTAAIALGLKIFIASLFMGLLLTSALWLINYAYILVVLDGYKLQEYVRFVFFGNYVFASLLVSCVLCSLWSFICYMIESQQLQRDATIKQLQIEMNMKEVQLNALAGKVDPHFVFNALNNIRALVDEDSEKARSAIVVLSDILRSPITTSLQNKIPLTEELTLVRNYISLSKIQFEDRLTYVEDVSEDVTEALIPSMMLQILVENAIKHGISQLPDGGVLSLQIRKSAQQLVCTIINHGHLQLNSSTSGFGVGTKIIHDRLGLLYDNNASFSLQEINNTVVAELILPLESSV